MKVTIEIPEKIFRKAIAKAVLRDAEIAEEYLIKAAASRELCLTNGKHPAFDLEKESDEEMLITLAEKAGQYLKDIDYAY